MWAELEEVGHNFTASTMGTGLASRGLQIFKTQNPK
jgi:hypothetical protein